MIIANEVSSTLSIYEVEVDNIPYTTLDITALMEGFYAGSKTMKPVLLNQGVSTLANECDTVTIQLYTPTNITNNTPGPYTANYSNTVMAMTNGKMIWRIALIRRM